MGRDQKLLKAGIFAMSLAIAFTVAAVALAATLDDEPGRAIAAEPAANVSAKESAVRPDPPVKPEAVNPEPVKPEVVKPEVVKPKREAIARREPAPEPAPHPKPQPRPEAKPSSETKQQPEPQLRPASQPEPAPRPKLDARPDPEPVSRPERGLGPRRLARADAPIPAGKERRKSSALRRPELPPGAVMSLTIKALGISGAPVRSSSSQRALDNGVIHEPDTSLPWDEGVQRNVYLVGHRLGWPGTGSHRIFYNLDKLAAGDRIVLRDGRGRRFEYRVTGSLLVDPEDSWVKDVVPGRDMVSLQTCTPIPTFEKRLIVRADRV